MGKSLKFRKKPVVIEAVLWIPNEKSAQTGGWPKSKAWAPARTWSVGLINQTLIIPTLEGDMYCKPGDWVIKSPSGMFFSLPADVFEQIYETVI